MQDSLPAGWLAFTGWELNPLDCDERFPSCYISSPSRGFILTLYGSKPDRSACGGLPHVTLKSSSGSGEPAATGRPSNHPSSLLKLYIYGYLNRVQSSRRLEREAGRNVEVMWLLGRLAPDHKTIADFRKDNGGAIK